MSDDRYLGVYYYSAAAYVHSRYDSETLSKALVADSYVTSINHAFSQYSPDFEALSSISKLAEAGKLLSTVYGNGHVLEKDTGILPPGVLHIDHSYVIFERPPMYQNVSVIPRMMDDIDYRRNEVTTYRIPIPWQVYIVNYVNNPDGDGLPQYYAANVRMLFTDGPIQSMDAHVYLPPLLNFYSNGDLCRPMYNDIEDIERFSKDVSGVIESAFDWIWNSGTNLDLTNSIAQYYYQLRGSFNDRTVFQADNDIQLAQSFAVGLGFHTYYCNYALVEHLLRSWEKLNLEDVIGLRWPNPSVTKSMQHEISDLYSDSLMEYVRENGYVSDDDMHYDEDSDTLYQCGENGCSCMGGEDVNLNDFMRWAKVGPYRVSNLKMSANEFLRECSSPQDTMVLQAKFGPMMLDRVIARTHGAWAAE